jgi:hypothetical protein
VSDPAGASPSATPRAERRIVTCLFVDIAGSDPCRIQLALAYALLARWADLEGMLPQFDVLAAKKAPLLGAFAAALREEIAAATRSGPPPAHRELRALGYLGFSELLSYRRA